MKPSMHGGNYQSLSSVDHDIDALLRLCPEAVLGKRIAVTSNDSGALTLTESDKELGWYAAADRKVFEFTFDDGRDHPRNERNIAYSPVLTSTHGLPNETHNQCREGYEEWYVFDRELPDSDIECFVNWMVPLLRSGFRLAVRSVLAANDGSPPGIVHCGRQRLHVRESERGSVRIRDRGVLRGPERPMTIYREEAPGPALAAWVECVWSIESKRAVPGHRVPPDGCLDIIYDRRKGLRAIGTMTVEQRFDLPQNAAQTGVRFLPGRASPFLGIAPAELTDGSVPLEDLWSRRARELTRQMDDAKSIRDAMRILLDSLHPPVVKPNPVQNAISAIAVAHGSIDLEKTARHANLSPRQFRRRCLEESGLTPKLLCRVLRFRHACRVARAAERPDWSAIALEAEYFDQAHFIHDFRAFTGLTPMAVFSNTRAGLERSLRL